MEKALSKSTIFTVKIYTVGLLINYGPFFFKIQKNQALRNLSTPYNMIGILRQEGGPGDLTV
jgi:hypothetical protein